MSEKETTKLTVRVSRPLLESAKQYAREHDTNLTRLIGTYLQQLDSRRDLSRQAPIVQRLAGSLTADVSLADYHAYLESKYAPNAESADRPERDS